MRYSGDRQKGALNMLYQHIESVRILDMAGQPLRTNKHHRRPRSQGGHSVELNIATVDPHQHVAWHLFASNHWATVVVDQINLWRFELFPQIFNPPIFHTKQRPFRPFCAVGASNEPKRPVPRASDLSCCTNERQLCGWRYLFSKEPDPYDVLAELRGKWLDPTFIIWAT